MWSTSFCRESYPVNGWVHMSFTAILLKVVIAISLLTAEKFPFLRPYDDPLQDDPIVNEYNRRVF